MNRIIYCRKNIKPQQWFIKKTLDNNKLSVVLTVFKLYILQGNYIFSNVSINMNMKIILKLYMFSISFLMDWIEVFLKNIH